MKLKILLQPLKIQYEVKQPINSKNIAQYLEMNGTENTMQQKQYLKGNLQLSMPTLKKKKRSQISNLTEHLNELEKENKTNKTSHSQ